MPQALAGRRTLGQRSGARPNAHEKSRPDAWRAPRALGRPCRSGGIAQLALALAPLTSRRRTIIRLVIITAHGTLGCQSITPVFWI